MVHLFNSNEEEWVLSKPKPCKLLEPCTLCEIDSVEEKEVALAIYVLCAPLPEAHKAGESEHIPSVRRASLCGETG
jgi:hypothetical protein